MTLKTALLTAGMLLAVNILPADCFSQSSSRYVDRTGNRSAGMGGNTLGEPAGADPGNPDVPIDGGISILLAAGAAYGAKKIHTHRKKSIKKTD